MRAAIFRSRVPTPAARMSPRWRSIPTRASRHHRSAAADRQRGDRRVAAARHPSPRFSLLTGARLDGHSRGEGMNLRIDLFNHVMPLRYLEMLKQHSKDAGIVKRMSNLRMLWDIEARVAMLREKFAEVRQVLTLGLPPPELLGGPAFSPELARIANDGMAEMGRKWPRQFPAFVASLPMNNVPAALEEMDRAIGQLGARGIQLCTSVAGRPLDEPEFFPVFERITNHRSE